MKQGLYKEYRRNEYNNANVKGAIDVKRHLRLNIPFSGKIAYTMREHSFDNQITQLIRHTIEFLAGNQKWKKLLSCDSNMVDAVNQIRMNTSSYNKNDRQKVINNNAKPFRHPYFSEYKLLQQICIQILRYEKLAYGKEKNKIYGLLFDGAWLWEEYLNTLLKGKFYHPRNKSRENGYSLFEKTTERIYPDFVSKKPPNDVIIADAKYKHLESDNRGDNKYYYQVMAYMYRFDSTKGFLMYPCSGKISPTRKTIIGERKGTLILLGFEIPNAQNFRNFSDQIKISEDKFVNQISI
jgi:5-methylcytosine-specific restriction endonuclease McrBC regulatory subunit McrC